MAQINVLIPKNALTMTEASIVEWLVTAGEVVTAGQPILVVETEKAQAEIEAPADGTVAEIRACEGETIGAGGVVATIDTGDSAVRPALAVSQERLLAPAAARLAEQLGIDPDTVQGSGPGGRVLEVDVIAMAQRAAKPGMAPEDASEGSPSAARLAGLRLTTRSLEVPAFHLSRRLPVASRDELRAAGGSLTDLVCLAAGAALAEVPTVNVVLAGDTPRPREQIRVAILDRDGDALVPVDWAYDPDCDVASVRARRKAALAEYRAGNRPPVSAAVMVSNLGPYGVDWFTALPYPGTVIMIALGSARPGDDGRDEVSVTLTCDHRAIDGIDGATFCGAVARRLVSVAPKKGQGQ